MRFTPTIIPGLTVIHLEPLHDERGFFARSWCRREFEAHGLNSNCMQCNVAYNLHENTLRGLHYQAPPHEEAKLIQVLRGAVYDVVFDVRPTSPTFQKWFSLELSAANHQMLYVPEGCAHGYLTLTDDCQMSYQMTAEYDPASGRGVRWNDPLLAGAWPRIPQHMSERDQSFPNFGDLSSRELCG